MGSSGKAQEWYSPEQQSVGEGGRGVFYLAFVLQCLSEKQLLMAQGFASVWQLGEFFGLNPLCKGSHQVRGYLNCHHPSTSVSLMEAEQLKSMGGKGEGQRKTVAEDTRVTQCFGTGKVHVKLLN